MDPAARQAFLAQLDDAESTVVEQLDTTLGAARVKPGWSPLHMLSSELERRCQLAAAQVVPLQEQPQQPQQAGGGARSHGAARGRRRAASCREQAVPPPSRTYRDAPIDLIF